MKPKLTIQLLQDEARQFAQKESAYDEPSLFGVTDGKKVGTYFEQKFQKYLSNTYTFQGGSSAKGIDFPDLAVDIKVTSITQPQSSCPFESAEQKVFGLGYSLLVFVYEKTDDAIKKTGRLNVLHTIYVDKSCTADYQTTKGIQEILKNKGNVDDLIAFIEDRRLPVDEIAATKLAERIIQNPPMIGYLTISNALQWRLQYTRVIDEAGKVTGIIRIV